MRNQTAQSCCTLADVARTEHDPAVIADELQSVVGALVRKSRAVAPASEVTLSQISVLKRLDREGPRSVADLARLDKVSHQSIGPSAAALTGRGLVRKEPDPHDRRRTLLVLTDEGRRLLAERRAAGHESLTDALATRLDNAERARLAEALELLRRLLD